MVYLWNFVRKQVTLDVHWDTTLITENCADRAQRGPGLGWTRLTTVSTVSRASEPGNQAKAEQGTGKGQASACLIFLSAAAPHPKRRPLIFPPIRLSLPVHRQNGSSRQARGLRVALRWRQVRILIKPHLTPPRSEEQT